MAVNDKMPKLGDPIELSASGKSAVNDEITCRIIESYPEPRLEAAWRKFLGQADYPAHYVSPKYFHEPFFRGQKPFAVLVLSADRVMAALTGTRSGKLVQCGISGRPQIALARSADDSVLSSLVEGLTTQIDQKTSIRVWAWKSLSAFRKAGYTERLEGTTTVLDLGMGQEALLKQFKKGRRSDIKVAQRSGVTVELATTIEQFRAYYEIYVEWCRRKRLERLSWEEILKALQLQGNRKLFLAYHAGHVVAGSTIRYVTGGLAEYSSNSSLESALRLRPNSLLVWSAIQWACDQKLTLFSMGGGHPFLHHFGGQDFPQFEYRLDRSPFKVRERLENVNRAFWRVARALRGNLRYDENLGGS